MPDQPAKKKYRDPVYSLRIPEELKKRLSDAAYHNRRSLHAEILERLEHSLSHDQEAAGYIEALRKANEQSYQMVQSVEKLLRSAERKTGTPLPYTDDDLDRFEEFIHRQRKLPEDERSGGENVTEELEVLSELSADLNSINKLTP